MKKITKIIPIALLAACSGATDGSQMPEAQFETVANYRIATELAQNCPRYEIKPDSTVFYANIDQQLTDGGLTAQQAQDMISGISDERMAQYRKEYYQSVGYDPSIPIQYCTLALRTVTARNDIALYLEPVSPSQ